MDHRERSYSMNTGYVPTEEGPFFSRLFDFTFTTSVAPSLIKILYILSLIAIGLGLLFIVIGGFTQGFLTGLVALVFGAVGALIYVILARLWLEIVIVLFRIEEYTERIANK
jgi:Domain of unknown function (DUF4282)